MDEKRLVRLLWIAKVSLLAVLLYTGFQVVRSRLQLGAVLDPGTASGAAQATEGPTTPPEVRSPSDYTTIVQRNLFARAESTGAAAAGSNAAQALDAMASAEELGLRLVGAVAGGPAASRAIIQNTRSNAITVCSIGDTIATTTVEAIQRDAVILRRNGHSLVLKLRAGTGTENKSDLEKGNPQNGKDAAVASPTNVQTAPLSSRAGYMTEIFRKATIAPYVKNDRTEGLRITGLEEFPMAEKLGLKNGDIIQIINGQQLTSKQKAFQVLMKARTQSKITLQLLRNGQRKDLSFDL